MSLYKIKLGNIRNEIRAMNLKNLLNSGEKNMIDEYIDKTVLKEIIQHIEKPTENKIDNINLSKTLNNIEEKNLYDSIINLKNIDRNVAWRYKFSIE